MSQQPAGSGSEVRILLPAGVHETNKAVHHPGRFVRQLTDPGSEQRVPGGRRHSVHDVCNGTFDSLNGLIDRTIFIGSRIHGRNSVSPGVAATLCTMSATGCLTE